MTILCSTSTRQLREHKCVSFITISPSSLSLYRYRVLSVHPNVRPFPQHPLSFFLQRPINYVFLIKTGGEIIGDLDKMLVISH